MDELARVGSGHVYANTSKAFHAMLLQIVGNVADPTLRRILFIRRTDLNDRYLLSSSE